MSETAANLYIPDYRAWSDFYEKRVKRDHKVGFGFQPESEALREHHQQELLVKPERINVCQQKITEPKIVSVVSPTEQTVQQAESVMKKAGIKVKTKPPCKKRAKKNSSRSKRKRSEEAKSKNNRRQKRSAFSYSTLGDIFSKRK